MFEYPKRSAGQCVECADDLLAEETHLCVAEETHLCGRCAQMLLEEERYDVPWELYEEEDDINVEAR